MPPLDDRAVGGLDVAIRVSVSSSKELFPETQQRVVSLVVIPNGIHRKFREQQHHIIHMKGSAVEVTHSVGASAEDGWSGPMTSGSGQDFSSVREHCNRATKGGVWHQDRHHGVSMISNKEDDQVIIMVG